jgi:hypothetical protein
MCTRIVPEPSAEAEVATMHMIVNERDAPASPHPARRDGGCTPGVDSWAGLGGLVEGPADVGRAGGLDGASAGETQATMTPTMTVITTAMHMPVPASKTMGSAAGSGAWSDGSCSCTRRETGSI